MQVKQLVERNKHLYLWRIAVFVLWGLSCLLSLFFSIKARAKSVVSTLICDVKLCLWVPMDMITPVLYVWKDYKPDQRITQLKLAWGEGGTRMWYYDKTNWGKLTQTHWLRIMHLFQVMQTHAIPQKHTV